jgi:8-oxo-dGTP pyrophosphatase MutT (NUDIX family)
VVEVLTGKPERAADKPVRAGSKIVRAGGGVVWRPGPSGVDVVLVHRPAYDDWSLPKGKLDAGESVEEAALREVQEETGLRCELGPEMATTRYRDSRGRQKVVRYWAMRPVAGELAADNEVDEAVWRALPDARASLSYDHDRDVLDSFATAMAAGRV